MRTALVNLHGPENPAAFSGTTLQTRRAFERAGADIVAAGPLRERGKRAGQVAKLAYRFARRKHERFRSPVLLRGYAAEVEDAKRATRADVAFGASSLPFAFMRGIAYGFWVDATFAGLSRLYPSVRPFAQRALRNGHETDRLAIAGATLAVYSSAWAATSAVEEMGGAPERVAVVPYGANLDVVPSAEVVAQHIDARRIGPDEQIELVFVGKEAHRKGADVALAAAAEIEARGRTVRLTFVGAAPEGGVLPPFARATGFLDTATDTGRKALSATYARAHAFVLPTRADCTPIVVAEAYALGVPAITSDVGGLPSMVSSESGALLHAGAPAVSYADAILALVSDADAYRATARAARQRYDHTFNWDSAARDVLTRLDHALAARA